jgi:hypothetical protein
MVSYRKLLVKLFVREKKDKPHGGIIFSNQAIIEIHSPVLQSVVKRL